MSKELEMLEKYWLGKAIPMFDPKNPPEIICQLCGKKYKRRMDFLTATLCEECKETELKRIDENYQKLKVDVGR